MSCCSDQHLHHYNTMASLIVRVDSIINIYDHFNVTPVPHVIRREANQLDLPTLELLVSKQTRKRAISETETSMKVCY